VGGLPRLPGCGPQPAHDDRDLFGALHQLAVPRNSLIFEWRSSGRREPLPACRALLDNMAVRGPEPSTPSHKIDDHTTGSHDSARLQILYEDGAIGARLSWRAISPPLSLAFGRVEELCRRAACRDRGARARRDRQLDRPPGGNVSAHAARAARSAGPRRHLSRAVENNPFPCKA
jgi:hypothetical protein